MENNKQNTALLIVIAVATLLVAVVGATFAYFTANSSNTSTSTVSTTSGQMTIAYGDGTNSVTISTLNVQPSDTILVNKTFTLTGTNTTGNDADNGIAMPYNVGLEYNNTFTSVAATAEDTGAIYGTKGEGSLVYWLSATTVDGVTATIDGATDTYPGQDASNKTVYYRALIPTSKTTTDYLHLAKGTFAAKKTGVAVSFNLIIVFPDTKSNQDTNKSKVFSGKIVVNDTRDTNSIKAA